MWTFSWHFISCILNLLSILTPMPAVVILAQLQMSQWHHALMILRHAGLWSRFWLFICCVAVRLMNVLMFVINPNIHAHFSVSLPRDVVLYMFCLISALIALPLTSLLPFLPLHLPSAAAWYGDQHTGLVQFFCSWSRRHQRCSAVSTVIAMCGIPQRLRKRTY